MADLNNQTEEALGWAAEGKKLAVDIPEVSLRDAATFVAEMTPIIGDALAAKEVYDELQKDEPNYYLAGALGGAALVGLVPGLGDVAAKAIKKGAREVFDVAKRVEVDPNAMSAFGVGAVKLRPNQADTFEEVMTPVKINKKGVKKTGESILRPTDEVSGRLEPRMSRAMLAETAGSVMPGPGKFFDPSRKGYKGDNFVGMLKDADIELDLEFGNYIMMGKGKPQDVSNKTFENLFVSARPSQKKTTFGKNNKSVARANLYDGPTLTIQDMKSNYKSATGNTGMEVRTNLLQPERFSMVTDEGKRSLDHPIVAVQSMSGKKDHFYTLDTQFVGPVRMDRLTKKVKRTNKDTGKVTEEVPQPNLRPATVGDINLGEQVGTIKVGKKEHPLYDYIEVDATMSAPEGMGSIQKFNQGGKVMKNQMEMAFMEEGGIADDGMRVDPVSGNEIPPGSMASEVRDDIPAQLSEGEYVVPADVLRYYGVRFFEDLRAEAKQGMAQMEADGRIGGEPVPVGGPQEGGLTPEDMAALEAMGLNVGGFIPQEPAPRALGNTTSPMPQMARGYDEGGLEARRSLSTPTFTRQSLQQQFPLGFSIFGNNTQQNTTTSPKVETVTLYGPDGAMRTLTLPAEQAEYDRLISEGYTLENSNSLTTETSVGQQNDGGGSGPVDTTKPGKPYGEMDGAELQQAFSDNERARSVLTAMGLINPVFGVVGRGATNMAEKQILEAMEKKGVKPPVSTQEGGILTNIFDTVKSFFGGDKDEGKTVTSTPKSPTTTTPPTAPTVVTGGGDDNDDPVYGGSVGDNATAAQQASQDVITTVTKDKSGNVDGVYTTGGTEEQQQTMKDYVTSASAGNKGGLMNKKALNKKANKNKK